MCDDPCSEAVLKHKKTREIVREWSSMYDICSYYVPFLCVIINCLFSCITELQKIEKKPWKGHRR